MLNQQKTIIKKTGNIYFDISMIYKMDLNAFTKILATQKIKMIFLHSLIAVISSFLYIAQRDQTKKMATMFFSSTIVFRLILMYFARFYAKNQQDFICLH